MLKEEVEYDNIKFMKPMIKDRKTTDNFSTKETTPKTTSSKINALMGERLLALLERVPSESQLYLQSMAEGLESMSHSNKYFFNCEMHYVKKRTANANAQFVRTITYKNKRATLGIPHFYLIGTYVNLGESLGALYLYTSVGKLYVQHFEKCYRRP
ncbi:unnamed protein product [Gordionus sp. m RMFG-2023]